MKPVLVCGLAPLGIAVVRQLVAKGERVAALASQAEAESLAHELKRLGVPVCVGVASSAGALEAAGLHEASAVIFTKDDDAENVDATLTARRLRRDAPIVARVFDPSLAQYLEETEAGLRVLSVSGLASPRRSDPRQAGDRRRRRHAAVDLVFLTRARRERLRRLLLRRRDDHEHRLR